MNMQFIVKVLVIFWGIILSFVIIKEIIPMLPTSLSFLSKISFNKNSNKNQIHFPLKEQYGFTLENTKGCIKNYKAGKYEKGFSYGTSSHCVNNNCSIDITFTEDIPKILHLYIEKNGICNLEKTNVPSSLDTVGYMLDLQLTQGQKSKLGIADTNKIRLKKAHGYEIDPQRQLYFYDDKIDQDTMLIDDKKIGDIYFGKTQPSENTTKLNVPHPKNLFTYTCNDKICQKEANTYILNIDGLDFIPPSKFIQQCLIDEESSIYCKKMITIGTIEHFNKPSSRVFTAYKNSSKNPEFDDSIEDWKKKRFEKAQKKVTSSLGNH